MVVCEDSVGASGSEHHAVWEYGFVRKKKMRTTLVTKGGGAYFLILSEHLK